MKTLPAALITEKNLLSSSYPWVVLLKITLTSGTILYLNNSNDTVAFDGHDYSPFPFSLDDLVIESLGSLNTINLRVSNVTRVFQAYMEALSGGQGTTVQMTFANLNNLDADYSEIQWDFDLISVSSDNKWITFVLGAENLMKQRFPLFRYIANHCKWVYRFKGAECKYAGEDTTCTGTLEDCRAKGNSANFGGYKGLSDVKTLRIAWM